LSLSGLAGSLPFFNTPKSEPLMVMVPLKVALSPPSSVKVNGNSITLIESLIFKVPFAI
jgi:hypothetical protein